MMLKVLAGTHFKVILLGAALVPAACAPVPEGTEKADIAYFEEAVASIDCKLVIGPHYNMVQFQTGLTREQTVQMVQYELGAGRAEKLASGGVRLTAGPCAQGAEPVTRTVEIKKVRA